MLVEVQVTSKLSPRDARTQSLITQRELSTYTDGKVSPSAISDWESGKPVRRLTAHILFTGLGKARQDKGLPPLAFDQIDWRFRGE